MKKEKKITFIGTGAWASALANVLSHNNYSVVMFGIDQNEINDINSGYNRKYFGNRQFTITKNIRATNNLEEALKDTKIIVFAIPSIAIRSVIKEINKALNYKKVSVINVSKGFDDDSGEFLSNLIKRKMGNHIKEFATFTGPSYATEVFNESLTLINVFASSKKYSDELIEMFNNSYFKLVPLEDEQGGELFAALKNVLAIAAGIISFQFPGKNAESAFISLGIKEILKIHEQINRPKDLLIGYELVGIGDIFLTCSSTQSRNFSFGLAVAEYGLELAIQKENKTVEGLSTAKTLAKILEKNKIKDIPLFESVIQVLLGQKNPLELTDFLKKQS
ncbi:NAD(P)H-dependent glycerol-3-phosphate dehydrogenase [Mycoplasmopsis sturni]|uniref:NAD(P)H-dependent glycerol-3-phosphate dehydrogenase n=1 Tax=Mycoplasmopsis sturni TaxID=39047 RepID=UPI000567F78E|nr:NAD(P)H-dependent glycerol-3-phosphate dehydrogenase [Mycoplasmopsis sturni]